jgi:exodeoxyribonuclease VII small subunit
LEASSLSFEEALKRLEAIVRRLEAGELSLEEALTGFEEGVQLVRFCRERLAAAEERLQWLVELANGTAECRPGEGEEPGPGL